MWNEPTKDRLSHIPKLYETEHIALKDKTIHLHFFIGGCDWYVAKYVGEELFRGFTILNHDYINAEWGYISFSELRQINIGGIEIDCELKKHWKEPKAGEIPKTRRAMCWKTGEKRQKGTPTKSIVDLLEQAVFDNIIEANCPRCGATIRCELMHKKAIAKDANR